MNGVLYNIFALTSVRERAVTIGMPNLLTTIKETSTPEMIQEIDYVLAQLNSTEPDPLPDNESVDPASEEAAEVQDELDDDELDLDEEYVDGETLLRTSYSMSPEDYNKRPLYNTAPLHIQLNNDTEVVMTNVQHADTVDHGEEYTAFEKFLEQEDAAFRPRPRVLNSSHGRRPMAQPTAANIPPPSRLKKK